MGMPTHERPASSLALAAGLGGFIAVVAAVAVIGAVLAAGLLTTPAGGHAAHGSQRFAVLDEIPTSFGYVAVEHAETLKGLTAKQLGGAIHGIGTFVGRDRALVKASVTLRNGPVGPLDYSPAQFRIAATAKSGKVTRYPLSHASVRAGVLQPDAAVDLSLGFIVPRDGSKLALEFADRGRPQPIVIDLDSGSGRATAAEKRAAAAGHGATGHDH
jgi:hypothetical protein